MYSKIHRKCNVHLISLFHLRKPYYIRNVCKDDHCLFKCNSTIFAKRLTFSTNSNTGESINLQWPRIEMFAIKSRVYSYKFCMVDWFLKGPVNIYKILSHFNSNSSFLNGNSKMEILWTTTLFWSEEKKTELK